MEKLLTKEKNLEKKLSLEERNKFNNKVSQTIENGIAGLFISGLSATIGIFGVYLPSQTDDLSLLVIGVPATAFGLFVGGLNIAYSVRNILDIKKGNYEHREDPFKEASKYF